MLMRWFLLPLALGVAVVGLFAGALAAGAADSFGTAERTAPTEPAGFQAPTATGLEDSEADKEALAARIRQGEIYARAACQQCHLFPDPALLDKTSWQNFVLPKMMLYLGLSSLDQVKVPDPDLVKASGILPPVPRIPRSQWGPIVTYYLHTAPAAAAAQELKPAVSVGLQGFELQPPKYRRDPPLTTLVSIDEKDHKIYTADAQVQTLDILDADGALEQSIEVRNIPVALARTERGLYLACIGHFFPSERKQGQVILLEKTARGYVRKVLLSELPRVSGLEIADLNNDGRMDLVLPMFGYLSGRLSWFENRGDDQFQEHVLFPKAGPMQAVVRDLNRDQAPDIVALVGQEHDGVFLWQNDVKKPGTFTPRDLVRKPPSFGPDHLELVDFDQDGLPDLLLANGDAADFPQPPKSYHGIRIFLNRGGQRFEEAFFYPLHGAFKAVARDFDQDGDLDVAGIAFFPDFENRPMESFVYLENRGAMKFSAATFPQSVAGRWLTMDAGDVDGDGDIDLVLGSLTEMRGSPVPERIKQFWQTRGPSVLILKNTRR